MSSQISATYGQVHAEEIAKEQRQVLDEFLVARVAGRVGRLQVHAERNDVGDGRQDLGEHLDEGLAIVGLLARRTSYLQTTNLGQTLESNVSELGNLQETRPEGFNKRGLEDITERDPVAEAQQGFEGGLDKAGLVGRVENFLAKLENLRELGAHGSLEVPCLCRRHLLRGIVEDLFGEKSQNDHVVLADRKARARGRDNLVDEGRPVVGPLLLEDGDENKIKLVEQDTVGLEKLFGTRTLEDILDDKVANT